MKVSLSGLMSEPGPHGDSSFRQALYHYGLPVPKPYDQSRHSIVMSLVDGFPMYVLSFPQIVRL